MLDALVVLNLGNLTPSFLNRVVKLAKLLNKRLLVAGGNSNSLPPGVEFLSIDPIEAVKGLTPYSFVVKKEKVSPLELLFFKPTYEEIVEEVNNKNFFLLEEDFPIPKRVLVYSDFENTPEGYWEFVADLLRRLNAEATLAAVLDESDEIFPLMEKEFPETELEEFLEHIVARRFKEILENLKGSLKISFVVLRGEAGTVVPHYAAKRKYDLLVVPQTGVHRDEFVENSTVSLALVYGLPEVENG